MESRIHIGVNPRACPTKQHGVLWVGVNERLPVIIDKPELIASRGLNYATWKRVKKQLKKMSILATHIELDFTKGNFENGAHFCYRLDKYEEMYCSGARGTRIYETINA
jgi:hypothetical protein